MLNYMVGNVSYAQLRQRTKLDLNCSIFLMALFTSMILMDLSGYSATNARKHTILPVYAQINQNQPYGHFFVPSLNANSKWVMAELTKRVTKWVIFLVLVVKQKKGKPSPPKPVRHGKDGRRIGI